MQHTAFAFRFIQKTHHTYRQACRHTLCTHTHCKIYYKDTHTDILLCVPGAAAAEGAALGGVAGVGAE